MKFIGNLPLIDNCLFFDHTSLEYVTTCSRSAYFHSIRKRRLAASKPALNFGGAMHEALAYRYKICPDFVTPKHTSDMHDILSNWFAEKPNPPEDHRQLDLAIAMIDEYNHIYATEPFSIKNHTGHPAVELPFAYELGRLYHHRLGEITIFWTGRIDAIVQEEGMVFTLDHKTSSLLGDTFFQSEQMSGQHRGYAWAYMQEYGDPPNGFIINAMRVPKPTQKNGLNVKPDGFQRSRFYLHRDEIEEWKYETIFHIHHFTTMHEGNYFPAHRKWCVGKYGACQYYDICSLAPEHREAMLTSGMYEEDDWSPLHPVAPRKL